MESIENIIKKVKKEGQQHYISREFQDYGYRLAQELNDFKHKSLYIKMSKEKPRALLQKALEYVADYRDAKNKAALFMWKLSSLMKEEESKK